MGEKKGGPIGLIGVGIGIGSGGHIGIGGHIGGIIGPIGIIGIWDGHEDEAAGSNGVKHLLFRDCSFMENQPTKTSLLKPHAATKTTMCMLSIRGNSLQTLI